MEAGGGFNASSRFFSSTALARACCASKPPTPPKMLHQKTRKYPQYFCTDVEQGGGEEDHSALLTQRTGRVCSVKTLLSRTALKLRKGDPERGRRSLLIVVRCWTLPQVRCGSCCLFFYIADCLQTPRSSSNCMHGDNEARMC